MGMYFYVHAGPYIRVKPIKDFHIESFCYDEMDEALAACETSRDPDVYYLISNQRERFNRDASFNNTSGNRPMVDPDVAAHLIEFKANFQDALDKLEGYAAQGLLEYSVHWGVFAYYS